MALIMIAEDQPDMASVLKGFFESRGHQVVLASDGFQLVERASEWQPDLVIADIIMPGVYGTTAAYRILDDPFIRKAPFVFVTGVAEELAGRMVPQGPKMRILHKPVDLEKLYRCVTDLLEQPAS
jgi:CheY-like chemotaxis protein